MMTETERWLMKAIGRQLLIAATIATKREEEEALADLEEALAAVDAEDVAGNAITDPDK